jgi:hypothetical protein
MRRLFGISRRFRLEALSSVEDFVRGQRPAQVICTAATAAMGCPPATKSHRKSTLDQECLPYLQDSRWPRVSCGTAATPAGIDTPRRQKRRPSVPTPTPLTQTATSSVSPTTSVLPAATTTTTMIPSPPPPAPKPPRELEEPSVPQPPPPPEPRRHVPHQRSPRTNATRRTSHASTSPGTSNVEEGVGTARSTPERSWLSGR